MLIIPAIDLKGGMVVRLAQGDASRQTVYSSDPVAVAKRWEAEGAPLLHLVDLDGAFSGSPQHLSVVAQVAGAVKVPVQLGGGLRTLADLERAFASGIERAVLGTVAIEDAEFLALACRRFAGRVVLGIDAKGGKVAVRGWGADTGVEATEVAGRSAEAPLAAIIYTDIARDGMLTGPNLEALRRIARATPHPVIASGGIATLDDVKTIAGLEPSRIIGALIGKALYEGRFTLKEAIAAANDKGC
jgi:phosphoribosylformimino-5-aminoimidazole carboxamide ribotide isomerase